ncbi:TetR/AcrR family transcriptional regulator [Pseudomonas kielensis]|jgi:TetR/AcrR family transcriptional repressor of nem operon|uniref:TetR/AcrR family transcriptional regulator n=1 Tax=Pseudomonas kielensis TaxID=2762577 RepID=UPI0015FE2DFD|nr:TetR/AcrR family transcriptional regulator [Pseudomonas kielensis]UZM15822.1 TetR/AcrR family transcriptional regulator [Pseudomonas kielensis]
MRTKAFNHDEIVDAAMQVFWQLGYSATSIQDLVDATGLSRSSLYNAFENKHGLYAQALRRYHELTARNITLLQEPGPVKELVRRLLMRIVNDELDGSAQRGCLAANAALELAGPDDSITELLAGNFLRLEKALEQALLRGQAEGEIASQKNPRALARFIVNTIQGLRVLSKGSARHQRRQRLLDVLDITLDAL